jgi:SAM-dependent methyltransferase
MQVQEFTDGLSLGEDGLFRGVGLAPVSYDDADHDRYLELEERSFWFQHRNECIAAAVRRLPPRGVLLDVGGGNGFVTRRLMQDGWSVVLLEPGPIGARTARLRRGIPQVINASLADARIRPGTLGAVGAFDVVEHVDDDRAFIERARDALADDGLLYLTVPAYPWLWSGADVAGRHQRRYTRSNLSALLEGCFEVLYLTYFFRPLVLPIFLLRSIPWRLGWRGRGGPADEAAEHGASGGAQVKVIRSLLRPEVRHIASGRQMRGGASILAVARKREALQ